MSIDLNVRDGETVSLDVSGGAARRTEENIEDIVGALVTGGTNVTASYNDGAGTLTIDTSALNEEEVEDVVAALLSAGNAISLTYNDASDTLTVAVDESALSFYDGTNLTADVDNSAVTTDDLDNESWQKWAIRNIVRDRGYLRHFQDIYFDTATTGTATAAANFGQLRVQVGTTSGSTAKLQSRDHSFEKGYGWDDDFFLLTVPKARTFTSWDDLIFYTTVGDVEGGEKGFGFKIDDGNLEGVVHDGTSETTTTLLTSPSESFPGGDRAVAVLDGPNEEAIFYVDGIEQGGIPSGLPSAAVSTERSYNQYIENTDAVSRLVYLASQVRVGVVR